MKKKDFFNKAYKNFGDFLSVAASRELDYFILDGEYTSAFNYRIKKVVEDIKVQKKDNIEFSILFNTNGEIAVIDAVIIGDFISDCYGLKLSKYYKDKQVDKIIKDVRGGNDKAISDFIYISYSILYEIIDEIYKEIKWHKDMMEKYKNPYSLNNYTEKDLPILMLCFLILEDICRYLGIDSIFLYKNIQNIISKKTNKT